MGDGIAEINADCFKNLQGPLIAVIYHFLHVLEPFSQRSFIVKHDTGLDGQPVDSHL